jgi:hypothetical protein
MVELEKPGFDTAAFLANAGLGRRIIQLAPQDAFFSQRDPADSVFYLQKGRAKVTVVSAAGKEATITLLAAGDFVGEEALAAMAGLRLATATAITACPALGISRGEMIYVMHEEHGFSDLFLKYLLERSMSIQADLVDQLFNSSEKRLTLISMWSIFRSPLMFGGDLPSRDAFTIAIVTNPEVLEVNQHSENGRESYSEGDTIAWTADIAGSASKYLTISNLGDTEKAIHLPWKSVGIVASKVRVRDLWIHKDLGSSDAITLSLRPHASVLLKVTAQ